MCLVGVLGCRAEDMAENDAKLLSKPDAPVECPKIRFKDAIPQIVASLAINLIIVQVGVNVSFSSILIPQLSLSESDIKIDLDSSSNLASIVTVATAAGALACGPLMDHFGRVRLAIFICAPFTAAWLLIVLSRHLYMIYAARVLSGFCGGV